MGVCPPDWFQCKQAATRCSWDEEWPPAAWGGGALPGKGQRGPLSARWQKQLELECKEEGVSGPQRPPATT